MKNKKITRKISQGMYVLTTKNGGCIVDSVMQISEGANPLIAVSVNKNNYTNELMKKNDRFALSVLGMDVNPEIIKTFGFNSMRDINKFENIDSFVDSSNTEQKKAAKDIKAFIIKGDTYPNNWSSFVKLSIDLNQFKTLVKQKDCSVTMLAASLLIYSIYNLQ